MTTKSEKKLVSIQELFDAGSHFGHPSRRWNPQMTKYIHSKRNGSHIINLSKTQEMLSNATNFLQEIVSKGGTCLFVGTKKHAQNIIKENADRSNSLYIKLISLITLSLMFLILSILCFNSSITL